MELRARRGAFPSLDLLHLTALPMSTNLSVRCSSPSAPTVADLRHVLTAPSLTPAERAIVKSFGSWSDFMISYGLKPHDTDDIEEAHSIVKSMAAMDEPEQGGQGQKGQQ